MSTYCVTCIRVQATDLVDNIHACIGLILCQHTYTMNVNIIIISFSVFAGYRREFRRVFAEKFISEQWSTKEYKVICPSMDPFKVYLSVKFHILTVMLASLCSKGIPVSFFIPPLCQPPAQPLICICLCGFGYSGL